MKCPVCLTHTTSPEDNSSIVFNGMCCECTQDNRYFYQSEGSIREISKKEALDNELNIINDILDGRE